VKENTIYEEEGEHASVMLDLNRRDRNHSVESGPKQLNKKQQTLVKQN